MKNLDLFKFILIYLLAVNIISFTMFYVDKVKARKEKWRIKEGTLHLLSFIGGSFGSIAAMNLFHHKTKKPKFVFITAVALIFNLFVLYKMFFYLFNGTSFKF